jgi:hypothetical protein
MTTRTVVLKNNTQSEQNWLRTFAPGEEYTIPTDNSLIQKYSVLEAVLIAVANGDASIGNGTEFFSTVSAQLNWLKGFDSTPRDEDGSTINRVKAAKAGWKAQFHNLRITSSKVAGIFSKKRDGSDVGFCTYTMKDANGATTSTEADCVETIVTWEPNHDMEIVGGQLLQKEPPTSDMFLWITAAAHIPAQYGGSIAFTEGGINLADIGIGGVVDFDGRASKFIAYDATNHSGKFEIALKHTAGVQHSFTITFELFKP